MERDTGVGNGILISKDVFPLFYEEVGNRYSSQYTEHNGYPTIVHTVLVSGTLHEQTNQSEREDRRR